MAKQQSPEQLAAFQAMCRENELDPKADVWQQPQSGIWIIARTGIEKIQYKNNIAVAFQMEVCQPDYACVKATATRVLDGKGATAKKLVTESFGSAVPGNCKVNYYAEMAEKRALSRAVLKNMGFYALAQAYGGDEAEEKNARTGCMGCPVASKDVALENIVENPDWAYLRPLLRLRPMFERLRSDKTFRKRKRAGERDAKGKLVKKQQRLGPLTMEARRWGVAEVLAIQAECNAAALVLGRPLVDILNPEEVARIAELMAANTWPDKWTGDEPTADEWQAPAYADGHVMGMLDFMKGPAA
ncbi:hypothetical protein ACVWYF_004170 [Hymenobacter sp. UYAg731]